MVTTKYRKATLEKEVDKRIREYFLEVANTKSYNIIEIGTNIDHAHILVEAENEKELSAIIRTLKAVSAKKLRDGTPRLRMGNGGSGFHTRKSVEERSSFWQRRCGFREIDDIELKGICEYIRDQRETHRI